MEDFWGRGSSACTCIGALIASVSVFALLRYSLAAQYVVGDQYGWSIPNSVNGLNYTLWAENINFNVGDSLLFNFAADAHNVLRVNKSEYMTCTFPQTQPIAGAGHVVINLTNTGQYYFMCGFPGHCSQGQKLEVSVSAVVSTPSFSPNPSTPTPLSSPVPATPSSGPSTTSAPSPGSSSALASPAPTSFDLMVVSIILAAYLSFSL